MADEIVIKTTLCMGLIILVLAFAPLQGEADIGCGTVVSYLQPCLAYLTNKGPIDGCCGGVQGLFAAAQTTADRQSVCRCLKSLYGTVPGIDLGKAAEIPNQCGVNVPYKISPSTDCSKVTLA